MLSPKLAPLTQIPQPRDSCDSMLPCPPSRNNFGSANFITHGLIAFLLVAPSLSSTLALCNFFLPFPFLPLSLHHHHHHHLPQPFLFPLLSAPFSGTLLLSVATFCPPSLPPPTSSSLLVIFKDVSWRLEHRMQAKLRRPDRIWRLEHQREKPTVFQDNDKKEECREGESIKKGGMRKSEIISRLCLDKGYIWNIKIIRGTRVIQ